MSFLFHSPHRWQRGLWYIMMTSSWWRHQMETFSALLAICAGNSPVPSEFPTQRPVTRSSDVFFDLRLNKQLSKQSWGWWFETLSRPLWRHRNGYRNTSCITGPLGGESTGDRWIPLTKGQWCEALMFPLLLVLTSCWTNSWMASDLRHHGTHVTSL